MPNITINTDILTDTEKAIAEFLAAKIRQTEEEKKVKMPWKPEYLERYFGIGFNGDISSSTNSNSIFDKEAWVIGNCFKTKEEAKFAAERLKVIADIRRLAEKNNPSDFNAYDSRVRKWALYYNLTTNTISSMDYYYMFGHGDRCVFASQKIAEDVIVKIGKERLKKYYFAIPDNE